MKTQTTMLGAIFGLLMAFSAASVEAQGSTPHLPFTLCDDKYGNAYEECTDTLSEGPALFSLCAQHYRNPDDYATCANAYMENEHTFADVDGTLTIVGEEYTTEKGEKRMKATVKGIGILCYTHPPADADAPLKHSCSQLGFDCFHPDVYDASRFNTRGQLGDLCGWVHDYLFRPHHNVQPKASVQE